MSALLKELMVDFGFLKEDEEGAEVEKQVKAQLDRATKMDEVDTVAFGLETDDNRMVKVYVKAEQANDFEKALAEKLGSVDSIEQALNELAKDFEIIAVDWPPECNDQGQEADELEDLEPEKAPGEDAGQQPDETVPADDQVTFNKGGAQGDGSMEPKESYKDQVRARLLGEKKSVEIASPAYGFSRAEIGGLDPYLNHPVQRMIYKAILELGVPDAALVKSAYRSQITQGIKRHASEVMKDSTLRMRLGYFLNQEIKQGEGSAKKEELELEPMTLAEQDAAAEFDSMMDDVFKVLDNTPDNKYAKMIKSTSAYKAMMRTAAGSASAAMTSAKSSMKMFRDKIAKTLAMRDQETRKLAAAQKKTTTPSMPTESIMTEAGWTFDTDSGKLVLSCEAMTINLDDENIERLIKGMSNREAVVVRDSESGGKYSFSPRGSAVYVKATGSQVSCPMESKEVDQLLDTIAKSELTTEELQELLEVSPPGWEGTVKAMKKHKEIDNPWALAWHMKKKGFKSRKKVEEELLDEKRRHRKPKAEPVEEPAPEVDDEAEGAETNGDDMGGDKECKDNGKDGEKKGKKGRVELELEEAKKRKKRKAFLAAMVVDKDDKGKDDEVADDAGLEEGRKHKKRKSFLDMMKKDEVDPNNPEADDTGMEPGLKHAPDQVGGAGKKKIKEALTTAIITKMKDPTALAKYVFDNADKEEAHQWFVKQAADNRSNSEVFLKLLNAKKSVENLYAKKAGKPEPYPGF